MCCVYSSSAKTGTGESIPVQRRKIKRLRTQDIYLYLSPRNTALLDTDWAHQMPQFSGMAFQEVTRSCGLKRHLGTLGAHADL